MQQRHRIQFPQAECRNLAQDEVYFYLVEENGKKTRIRFHDYDRIYNYPGLYEQLFYDRLRCDSPRKVAQILKSAIDQTSEPFTALRVLDLGAGNGLVGEALKQYGVSRLVGVDIIPEAHRALERDRPHVYDAYYVTDFCRLKDDMREELGSWEFDCLTTVAALGFGDIPPLAFIEALNLLHPHGWVAFNIKETFFHGQDDGGFSSMIRDMIFSRYISIYHLERYRHRLSMEGEPLYYYAIAARKNDDVPQEFIDRYR